MKDDPKTRRKIPAKKRDPAGQLRTARVQPEPDPSAAAPSPGAAGSPVPPTRNRQIELEEAVARLEAVIRAFDGLVYICSRDYRVVFMNERFIRRTGYDATGELCYRALHGLDDVCPWCVNDRVFLGETVRWEIQSPRDGRWYSVVDTPICLPGGKVLKQAMILDITDRKAAEDALRESESRYRSIVEDQTDLICRFLPDGTLRFVNEAYCRNFDRSREALVGYDFFNLIPEADQETVRRNIATLSPENPVNTQEHRVMLPDGTIGWQLWTNRAIFDDRSRPVEYQAVGKDITERKLAEEALREARQDLERLVRKRTSELQEANRQLMKEVALHRQTATALQASEERYRSVVDHIGVGVALISPRMEILTLNNQMRTWFPHIDPSRKPVCYESFNNPPREGICSYCPTCRSLEDGRVHEAVTDTPLGEGIRHYRIIASPVCDPSGRVVAAIEMVEEITERLRIGKALKARERELEDKTRNLEEANTALKVLLKRREEDRTELEEQILANLRELTLPYLDELKRTTLDERPRLQVDLIERKLNEFASPFLQRLKSLYATLTPREIQIADLVKDGRTTKEIAGLLNASVRSVEFHRDNLRRKCGLTHQKVNLRSHLLMLS